MNGLMAHLRQLRKEHLYKDINRFEQLISTVQSEIEQIKNSYPYSLRQILDDEKMLEIDGHRRNQESEAKPKVDWSRQKKNAELISTFFKNSLKLFYFDFCAYFF